MARGHRLLIAGGYRKQRLELRETFRVPSCSWLKLLEASLRRITT
jgi:hypothetical protein